MNGNNDLMEETTAAAKKLLDGKYEGHNEDVEALEDRDIITGFDLEAVISQGDWYFQSQNVKIGEIKGITNVGMFLEKLSQSFPLSEHSIQIIKGLINPTHYSYFINLELREEASYESVAYHTLKIDTFSDNSLVTGKFYYQWITSSDHEVVIESNSDRMFFHEGDWQDNHCESYKPIFSVYIGKEESSCFYPTIKNIFADMQKEEPHGKPTTKL